MSKLRSRSSSPRPRATPAAVRPGVPPLIPVLAPIVVAAIVIGFIFSRYLSAFAPEVPTPVVRLEDATTDSGIRFIHHNGATDAAAAPTTLGSGVVVLDYDQDGAPDLFFVNGADWKWLDGEGGRPATSALFHNDGHGHFTDVSATAGVALTLQGMGAAAGDFDNDGYPDLFVTAIGRNHLLRNRGDGTFADVTARSGIDLDAHTWSTGALWLDLDGDGRLDLVVCRYARWSPEVELEHAFKVATVGRSYGAPAGFFSATPLVYLNLGDGRFAEESARLGLSNVAPDTRLPRPEPLGVTALDGNGDGRLDLLFFYHGSEPTLFLNEGGGHFHEWTSGGERREGAAGLIAFHAVPLRRERGTSDAIEALQSLEGSGATSPAGAGRLHLGTHLGMVLFDYDLDGHLEIFSGSGRAEPELGRFEGGRDFAAAPVMLWDRGESWAQAAATGGGAWAAPLVARGVATADLDGDGDLDVIMTQNGGPARVLRNDQHLGNASLRIRLVGTRSVHDGTGARVEVHAPRRTLTRLVAPEMGYLSQSEATLTFGLGEDSRVRRVTVFWPSGVRQDVTAPEINKLLVITEPK